MVDKLECARLLRPVEDVLALAKQNREGLGPLAQQQVILRFVVDFAHRLARAFVRERSCPAAESEAAGSILLGSARPPWMTPSSD